MVDEIDEENLANSLPYYVGSGEAVYYATKQHNISGRTGLIIGSETPWVEAFCLKNGAKKLITIDYINVMTNHSKIKFYHALDFAKKYEKHLNSVDFVVSYSSIEHAGLGRYGDTVDPIGDIREVEKAACWLKNGGLFFLGVPVGKDHLTFNLHRIYGKLRLPLVLHGFHLLNIFDGNTSMPIKLSNKHLTKSTRNPNQTNQQLVFVLKKL